MPFIFDKWTIKDMESQIAKDQFLNCDGLLQVLGPLENDKIMRRVRKAQVDVFAQSHPDYWYPRLVLEFYANASVNDREDTILTVVQGNRLRITQQTLVDHFSLPSTGVNIDTFNRGKRDIEKQNFLSMKKEEVDPQLFSVATKKGFFSKTFGYLVDISTKMVTGETWNHSELSKKKWKALMVLYDGCTANWSRYVFDRLKHFVSLNHTLKKEGEFESRVGFPMRVSYLLEQLLDGPLLTPHRVRLLNTTFVPKLSLEAIKVLYPDPDDDDDDDGEESVSGDSEREVSPPPSSSTKVDAPSTGVSDLPPPPPKKKAAPKKVQQKKPRKKTTVVEVPSTPDEEAEFQGEQPVAEDELPAYQSVVNPNTQQQPTDGEGRFIWEDMPYELALRPSSDHSQLIPLTGVPHPELNVRRLDLWCAPLRPSPGDEDIIKAVDELYPVLEAQAISLLEDMYPEGFEPQFLSVRDECLRYLCWTNWRHGMPATDMFLLEARLGLSFWAREERWATAWAGTDGPAEIHSKKFRALINARIYQERAKLSSSGVAAEDKEVDAATVGTISQVPKSPVKVAADVPTEESQLPIQADVHSPSPQPTFDEPSSFAERSPPLSFGEAAGNAETDSMSPPLDIEEAMRQVFGESETESEPERVAQPDEDAEAEDVDEEIEVEDPPHSQSAPNNQMVESVVDAQPIQSISTPHFTHISPHRLDHPMVPFPAHTTAFVDLANREPSPTGHFGELNRLTFMETPAQTPINISDEDRQQSEEMLRELITGSFDLNAGLGETEMEQSFASLIRTPSSSAATGSQPPTFTIPAANLSIPSPDLALTLSVPMSTPSIPVLAGKDQHLRHLVDEDTDVDVEETEANDEDPTLAATGSKEATRARNEREKNEEAMREEGANLHKSLVPESEKPVSPGAEKSQGIEAGAIQSAAQPIQSVDPMQMILAAISQIGAQVSDLRADVDNIKKGEGKKQASSRRKEKKRKRQLEKSVIIREPSDRPKPVSEDEFDEDDPKGKRPRKEKEKKKK